MIRFALLTLLLLPAFSARAQYWSSCRELAAASRRPCKSDLKGGWLARCEVCREGRSCFMALSEPDRSLCEAYREGDSCFRALNGRDRAWCEVLKEGKRCRDVFRGRDLEHCEYGITPEHHYFWMN